MMIWAPTLVLFLVLSPGVEAQCEVAQLSAPEDDVDSRFGARVAIDGDVLVVVDSMGLQWLRPPAQGATSGTTLVFRYDGAEWGLEAVITPFIPSDIVFGASVAICGDTLAIGSVDEEGAAPQSGAAHIYRFEPQSLEWIEQAQLFASDGAFHDLFGYSISIDGGIALVGAPLDDTDGQSSVGSAYVFRRVGESWIEEAKLMDPEGAAFDYFGISVAIQGDLAVVGAHGNDHPDIGSGSAFVFRRTGEEWILEQELIPFDSIGNQWFGESVSLANDVILVGARQDNDQNGAAYVFRHVGDTWVDEAKLTAQDPVGPFPLFGYSVCLDETATTALIGAYADFAMGFEAGAAHLFRFDGTQWAEVIKLTASDGIAGDLFGITVAMSGDTAVVGGPGQVNGDVYVFAGASAVDCNWNTAPDACEIFEGTAEDLNADGVPDECAAAGDLNGDGVVDVADLLAMLAAWGPCAPPCPMTCIGDIDENCVVDVVDLLILLGNWGNDQ